MNNYNGFYGFYGFSDQLSATIVAINMDFMNATQQPHRGISRCNPILICEMAMTSRSPKSV